MKQILTSLLLCCSLWSWSQNSIEEQITEGIRQHDLGNYETAMDIYTQVIRQDSLNETAYYEYALSAYHAKMYDKSIKACDKVIKLDTKLAEQAYIVKGSSLDDAGDLFNAILTYREGLDKFPNSHLLHYNLGYTYFSEKKFTDAESSFINALNIKMNHASSHLGLARTNLQMGRKVEAILGLEFFLLLENSSERSKSVFELLREVMQDGVTITDEKSINISLSPKGSNPYHDVETLLAMTEATQIIAIQNNVLSQGSAFVTSNKVFLPAVEKAARKQKGFYIDVYVKVLGTGSKDGHCEAISNIIANASQDEVIKNWIQSHEADIIAFTKWLDQLGDSDTKGKKKKK